MKTISSVKSVFNVGKALNQEVVIEYPNDFLTRKNIIERERDLVHGKNKGHVKEYLFDGVCIEQREVSLFDPMEIQVEHSFPYLKMHFELEGYSSYSPKNTESLNVEIPGGHHQLFYFPKVKGQLQYRGNTHRKTLEITLSLQFIKNVFRENWEVLASLGEALCEKKPLVFGSTSQVISSDIQCVIQQIVNCSLPIHLQKTYIQAKVIELLVLQIDQLSRVRDPHEELNDTCSFRVIAAKDYIESNLNNEITIAGLSKTVGLNSTQLKEGFKQKYQLPIIKYVTKKRMEKALHLVTYSNESIAEIANLVGYKYSQHFTKAFKKEFGVTPSSLRAKK